MAMRAGKMNELVANIGEPTRERENDEWLKALKALYFGNREIFYLFLSGTLDYEQAFLLCDRIGVPRLNHN